MENEPKWEKVAPLKYVAISFRPMELLTLEALCRFVANNSSNEGEVYVATQWADSLKEKYEQATATR